jgi:hypothetical protein
MAYDKALNGVPIVEANRFSVYVRERDRDGLAELQKWVDWFKKDGIVAVIGFTRHGYAVYRVGLDGDESR